MRGQWLGVRRGPSSRAGTTAQAVPQSPPVALLALRPVVHLETEAPFHRLLRPLLTMPAVGSGSEDAVTPREAADVSDVDVSEVVGRWRAEKDEHTCGSCCGRRLLDALDALGGVATLRELALADAAGPSAYASIRTCVEAKATGSPWRRSGRSVLVSAPGTEELLDATIAFRSAVDDERAHDADQAQLAALVGLHRLDALEELTPSRLKTLVEAFGGHPRTAVLRTGAVPEAAPGTPSPSAMAAGQTSASRRTTVARPVSEERRPPVAGGAVLETPATPSPRTAAATGQTTPRPMRSQARPAGVSAVPEGAGRLAVPAPSAARRLPTSPWAQPVDSTPPRQRLRVLVDEVLERKPWSSAAEVTIELRRARGMDVPRGEVNALLYRERDRYEQRGESPPRWCLVGGAPGAAADRPVVLSTPAGVGPRPAVVASPGTVRPAAPRLRPASMPATPVPSVQPARQTPPAQVLPPARLAPPVATPTASARLAQATHVWRGRPGQGLRSKESQQLALAAWRENGHRGVIDGLDGEGRLGVGAAAVAAAWRVGQSTTVLTPDSEGVQVWSEAVERAGVALRDVHRGELGRLLPQRMGLVCVTTPFQARAHAVQAPRTRDNLVVVDELHRFMTGAGLRVLDDSFTRRLGLVTTPAWSDPSPGRLLAAYFEPVS